MFGFRDRKVEKLRALLRRLTDQTTPARVRTACEEQRTTLRYNRVLPVLMVPFGEDGKPLLDESQIVLSRDLSDSGISLAHQHEFELGPVIIGIWFIDESSAPHEWEEPILARGRAVQRKSIGGGFIQTGVEFDTLYDDPKFTAQILPLAATLLSDDAQYLQEGHAALTDD